MARHALHAITLRLDGGGAAAATITCKRAVFHNALGYAAGLGLLPANLVSQIAWRLPHPCAAGWPREQVTSPTSAALSSSPLCVLSKARDDLLRAVNRKQDIDVAEDALIALDTCLAFLVGARDAAARVAHRMLGLAPGHVRRAGWQSSSWLKGRCGQGAIPCRSRRGWYARGATP